MVNKKILVFLLAFLSSYGALVLTELAFAQKEKSLQKGEVQKRRKKSQRGNLNQVKERKKKKIKKKSRVKTKAELQEDFSEFYGKLFEYTGRLRALASNSENMSTVFMNLSVGKREKIDLFFQSNRDLLYALSQHGDLHIFNNVKVIPQTHYEFVQSNFGLKKQDSEIDVNRFLLKMVGGTYEFEGEEEKRVRYGLLDLIKDDDLSLWKPIRKFIYAFEDTITQDKELAAKVGKTMLPFLRKYYTAMDVQTRLQLFQNIFGQIRKGSRSLDLNLLTTKIFQSSGPLLIKMMQELQEEIKGPETPVTKMLKDLDEDPVCMPDDKVEKLVASRLKTLIPSSKHRKHKLVKRLGVASIAQAHEILVKQGHLRHQFAVKVQKEGVSDLFYREKKFVEKMLDSNDDFDKGMKQWIRNICDGIEEELDFTIERSYVRKGLELYTDSDKRIRGLSLPYFVPESEDPSSKTAKKALFMEYAKGEEVAKYMDADNPEDLAPLYEGIKRLYRKYLEVAIGNEVEENFYHGDLHRGNIRYDVKTDMITMIDFGNAGRITPFVRRSLLNIYKLTNQINGGNREAIAKLGEVLEAFILGSFPEPKKGEEKNYVQERLIKTYFSKIFNLEVSKEARRSISSKLDEETQMALISIKEIKAKIENSQASEKDLINLSLIKDNLDFRRALMNNCLAGRVNTLARTLVTPDSLSRKLRKIFEELQKNGIAMPKEAIFFNKSNVLLQGILENLRGALSKSDIEFTPVEPDVIFTKFLEKASEEGSSEI